MALTADEVVSKTFQPTKFREGYDQDEVDDFLDEVVNTLRSLSTENDELTSKLAACESRVGELSRAGAAPSTSTVKQEGHEPEPQSEAGVQPAAAAPPAAGPVSPVGPEAATGMLALAQRLHDEHVRSGEEQRDQLVSQAQQRAEALVSEAEQRRSETLGALDQERARLEGTLEELRSFEREYRTRLKAYLETQLQDLESRGTLAPGG